MDMVLIVAVLAAGFMVVKLFLTPLPAVEVTADLDAEEDGEANIIGVLGDRTAYAGLTKSGLFGTAGKWDAVAQPEPEPEPEIASDIEESTLGLKLRGTIALEPGDPFSAAFIENEEKRDGVRSYLLGQDVVENVSVDTILRREVILLNKRKNPPQRERLRMEESETFADNSASAGMPGRRGAVAPEGARTASTSSRGGSVQHTTVNRDTIIREALENYSALAAITPEVKYDEAGNVLGLTAEGIGSNPLAVKLGFQEGDVLQTVNNERIDSREQLLELFERYQNSNSFRIGVLRDGRPNVLVFDVE